MLSIYYIEYIIHASCIIVEQPVQRLCIFGTYSHEYSINGVNEQNIFHIMNTKVYNLNTCPGKGVVLAGLRGRVAVPRGAEAEPRGAARSPGPAAAPPAGSFPSSHVERQARAAHRRAAPGQAGAVVPGWDVGLNENGGPLNLGGRRGGFLCML